ncbi:MAG: phosphoesterase family protein, partial [Acidobacteria bacterium]|nr:phosphoesterase family protein [Acidobacteriota bacterium]
GGSSPPNRINNDSFTGTPYDGFRTIFGVFNDRKGVTAKIYAEHFWRPAHQQYFTEYMFPYEMSVHNVGGSIHHFEHSVRHDQLPTFSYIEPTFFGEDSPTLGTDYHPPGSLFEGEKFLRHIYDILRSHPKVFKKSLLIVTFDEHGGTYDHVPPPTNAPVPDTDSPDFTRYGVRVPTLLISPWVQPGTVFRGPWYPGAPASSLPFDHTSVLATLMKWREIPYQAGQLGYLRDRTAVAPTFEDVITNVMNASWPELRLPGCHDLGATFAATGVPRSAIQVGIHRITNFPPEHPEHQRILAEIQSRVTTDHQLAAEFRKLIEEYGMRQR